MKTPEANPTGGKTVHVHVVFKHLSRNLRWNFRTIYGGLGIKQE
jgi:hypothetical protein